MVTSPSSRALAMIFRCRVDEIRAHPNIDGLLRKGGGLSSPATALPAPVRCGLAATPDEGDSRARLDFSRTNGIATAAATKV